MLKPIGKPTQAISRRLTHQTLTRKLPFQHPLGVGLQRNSATCDKGSQRLFSSLSWRSQQAAASVGTTHSLNDEHASRPNASARAAELPLTCPGCGALSQTIEPDAAGYYGSKRAVRITDRSRARQQEDEIFRNALNLGALPPSLPATENASSPVQSVEKAPICDRCHYLRYQSRGTGIIHPSMQSIQQIIEESPHKHNHIYHIVDAADFPMSLIPNLQNALKLPRLRTQNRRSKSMSYIRGRLAEVSFIITRSDLLAPKKEQVDSLVPYLREVLRDALGRSGKNVRLGNVRCVSAYRGWWTRTVKEDIWSRGGAGWMVGKVNVGKSALYEVVFPKGRNQVGADLEQIRRMESQAVQDVEAKLDQQDGTAGAVSRLANLETTSVHSSEPAQVLEKRQLQDGDEHLFEESKLALEDTIEENQDNELVDDYETGTLLPPLQMETAYPHMPLVSALPGTTASPIRIPFGNGKGELIDLPGIHRSSFDTHIKTEHHKSLIMQDRVTPEQFTIKPGQSILIGGIVRITPKTEDLVFLAYPFVPLKAHVTHNDKAMVIQTGIDAAGEPYSGTVESVATDDAKQSIESAGTFQLKWDVTKRRTGSLTEKAAGKLKAANLPFTVYSADILIESVGWVELTCQVRNRRKQIIAETFHDAFGEDFVERAIPVVPEVEVFTPEGKFVAVRRPMNAWLLGGPKKPPKHLRHARPRQSISMAKRRAGGAAGQKRQLAAVA